MRAVPGLVETEPLIERELFEERQDRDPPAQERLVVLADRGCREPAIVDGGEVVKGQADELEVVDGPGAGVRGCPDRS
jgi:hypothetical protein